jgi:flagellar biosynthesis/type III secretory pathway M-ring protein FliF/YscJ
MGSIRTLPPGFPLSLEIDNAPTNTTDSRYPFLPEPIATRSNNDSFRKNMPLALIPYIIAGILLFFILLACFCVFCKRRQQRKAAQKLQRERATEEGRQQQEQEQQEQQETQEQQQPRQPDDSRQETSEVKPPE